MTHRFTTAVGFFFISFAQKMCDMKLRFLAVPSALLATLFFSCEKVDTEGHTINIPQHPSTEPDTVLLMTAVRVPGDYDWHRDTAAGASSCELLLYKDMELSAVYGTGPQFCISTDPDTHHLINGHLYTEYVTEDETVIKCDGEELFRYSGREFLVGLLPFGSNVYTLGRRRSGSVYTFRKNGEVLMELDDCRIFGDFCSSAYGRTGALYKDGNHFCFCYRDLSGKYWKVLDGENKKISIPTSAEKVIDVKIHDSKEYILYEISIATFLKGPSKTYTIGNEKWYSAGVVFHDGNPYVLGNRIGPEMEMMHMVERHNSAYVKANGSGAVFSSPALFVYGMESEGYAVIPKGDGFVVEDGTDALFEIPSAYLFTRDCAVVTEDGFLIAVNPRHPEHKPSLLGEYEEYVIDINGYITSVALEIKR